MSKLAISIRGVSKKYRLGETVGYHTLRGVRDPREIYGLDLGSKA